MILTFERLIVELTKVIKFEKKNYISDTTFLKLFIGATSKCDNDEVRQETNLGEHDKKEKNIFTKCDRSLYNILNGKTVLMPKDAKVLLNNYNSDFLVEEAFDDTDDDVLDTYIEFLKEFGYEEKINKYNVGEVTSKIYVSILSDLATRKVTRNVKSKTNVGFISEPSYISSYNNVSAIHNVMTNKTFIITDGIRYFVSCVSNFMSKLFIIIQMIIKAITRARLKAAI